MKSIFLFILYMIISMHASSEVFRWTDENGQVHFSDQARAPSKAEQVNIDTSKINITSNLSTPEQLQRLAEEKDQRQQQKFEAWKDKIKKAPKNDDWCTSAKARLQKIVGRVVFLDDNNLPVQVSEEERKSRVKALSQSIESRCN